MGATIYKSPEQSLNEELTQPAGFPQTVICMTQKALKVTFALTLQSVNTHRCNESRYQTGSSKMLNLNTYKTKKNVWI